MRSFDHDPCVAAILFTVSGANGKLGPDTPCSGKFAKLSCDLIHALQRHPNGTQKNLCRGQSCAKRASALPDAKTLRALKLGVSLPYLNQMENNTAPFQQP